MVKTKHIKDVIKMTAKTNLFEDDLQKENEDKIRLYERVFQHASEGIIITDSKGRILSTNPAFTITTGYTEEEALGKTPKLLQSNRHDRKFYIDMWALIHERGNWQGEIWNRRKNGEIYPEWLSINAVKNDKGHITNYVGIFSDITERKKSEEHLKFLAHYDVLTELPNRFLFYDRLNQSILQAQRLGKLVSVMFLDLDRFKGINDTFGHGIGDHLLQQVAQKLRKCVRKSDTVARLGGDEFTVILPNLNSSDDAKRIAEKIIEELSQPIVINDQEFFITTSIGISLYPYNGTTMEALIKNADAAMYRAKEKGCTFLFFEQEIKESLTERFFLENGLALERNELFVYYQPQIDPQTREINGVEALLRWKHPVLGLISPSDFISIAEETGWIVPIGEWVIHTACRQNKLWQDLGYPPVKVSINISARQLLDQSLINTVSRALFEKGLDPIYLELEITESINVQQIDSVAKIITELKALGISVSIDDFGTGYSGISYLKNYPVDTLKIDRSFVKNIESDHKNAAIAKGIIEMAHGLELNVIAEGVEREEELAFFKQCKCSAVQGFLFSKPVPAEQIQQMFRKTP
jgi:diguanylate cyclase (GGDEF)-like protein/PAS domain S-box-containing protein